MLASELIQHLGGRLIGEDRAITQLAPLAQAQAHEISFCSQAKMQQHLDQTQAALVIVNEALSERAMKSDRSLIVTDNPYLYFAKVACLLKPETVRVAGIHARAVCADSARIASSAFIAANVVIGERCVIGERVRIEANAVLGDDVCVGDDTVIHPNVTLYDGVMIGARNVIHAGAVIGADGFGLAWNQTAWLRIPQTGSVRLGDDVDVGANTTIDRGALSDTLIGDDVKIDNLVQIAHNVEVGAHTAIAGCTGIAGSAKIGASCVLGGAVMMVGHINIEAGTHIGGGTLVPKSLKKGHYASSYPITLSKDWVKHASHLRRLDDWVQRIKQLEQQLASMAQDTPHESANHDESSV